MNASPKVDVLPQPASLPFGPALATLLVLSWKLIYSKTSSFAMEQRHTDQHSESSSN
jgi:hypothetical protein